MISISEVSKGRFTCETATESTTEYLSQGMWEGRAVGWVTGGFPPCDEHEFHVVCEPSGHSTGVLYCPACSGIADEPD